MAENAADGEGVRADAKVVGSGVFLRVTFIDD